MMDTPKKNKEFDIISANTLKTKKFNKFTIPELKYSLRHYEIKFKSNLRKQDLFNLLNRHIMSQTFTYEGATDEKVIKLQKNIRRWMVKNKVNKFGLGTFNISKCQNEEDPITLEPLSEINPKNLVIYRDKDDNKYYGFEIINLYDLFEKKDFENPLTLKPFEQSFIDNFLKNCRERRNYLPQQINNIKTFHGANKKILEIRSRAFDLFHNYHILTGIPNLESQFYLELTTFELKRFYDGLQDLWDYRILQDVQNPNEFHRKYVPDDISVFSKNKCNMIAKYFTTNNRSHKLEHFDNDSKCQNLLNIHDIILTDLENFVKYPKEDDKTTTIFWVLTVLTEINLYSAEKLGQFLVF